jgi:hypothetical protein
MLAHQVDHFREKSGTAGIFGEARGKLPETNLPAGTEGAGMVVSEVMSP